MLGVLWWNTVLSVPEPVPWGRVVDFAAIITALTVITTAGIKLIKPIRELVQVTNEMLTDWRGIPARPGVPARPGILIRLEQLEAGREENAQDIKDIKQSLETLLSLHEIERKMPDGRNS